MAIGKKSSLLLLLLLSLLSATAFGLECYCDQNVGVNDQCYESSSEFGTSCDGSIGVCYTTHVITPHLGLLVFAGCLDNATNPVGEQCSGALNTETRVHQCCKTSMCNQEFYTSNPFPTAPPTAAETTPTPDNNSATDGTVLPTDSAISSGSGSPSTTVLATSTAEPMTAPGGSQLNGTPTTLRPTTSRPTEFDAVVVSVAVSVSIILLVAVSMAVLIILTHQRWTLNPHQSKDAGSEENSETELKPSSPPTLHILKSQQASTTQVHPQLAIHKPAVHTVVAGQTIVPAMENIICWDSDGKGS